MIRACLTDRDWRLRARATEAHRQRDLAHLVQELRHGGATPGELEAVSDDVVLTHDGELLFAYAASEDALASARRAIEDALRRKEIRASVSVSHWDDLLDDWRQIDPPPDPEQAEPGARPAAGSEDRQTRTLVAVVGKLARATLEQSMLAFAQELGIECTIFEHPHLLSAQVGFRITGPPRKLDEFADGLNAECAATIRTERGVMLSPL